MSNTLTKTENAAGIRTTGAIQWREQISRWFQSKVYGASSARQVQQITADKQRDTNSTWTVNW